jgi:hypothetical protein
MKDVRVIATFVLTLLVWMYYDLRTPPSTLGATETLVVAAIAGAVIYVAAWAVKKFRPKKEEKPA